MVRLPDFNPLGKTKQRLNQSYIDLHGLSRKNTVFDKLKRRFSQSERDVSTIGLDIARDLQSSVVASCEDDGFIMYNVMSSINDDSGASSGNETEQGLIKVESERRRSTSFEGFSDIIDIIQGEAQIKKPDKLRKNGQVLVKPSQFENENWDDLANNEVVIANKSSDDRNLTNGISNQFEKSTDLDLITTNNQGFDKNAVSSSSEKNNVKKSEGYKGLIGSSSSTTQQTKGGFAGNSCSLVNDTATGLVRWQETSLAPRHYSCDFEADFGRKAADFKSCETSKGEPYHSPHQDMEQRDGLKKEAVLRFPPKVIADCKTEAEFRYGKQTADYDNVDKGLDSKTKCANDDVCRNNRRAGEVCSTDFSKISVSFDPRNHNFKIKKDLIKASQIGCIGQGSDSANRSMVEKDNTEFDERFSESCHRNKDLDSGVRDRADGLLFMRNYSENMNSCAGFDPSTEHDFNDYGCGGRTSEIAITMLGVAENKTSNGESEEKVLQSLKEWKMHGKHGASKRTSKIRSSWTERSLSEESVTQNNSKCSNRTRRLYSAPELLHIGTNEKAHLERIYKDNATRPRSVSLKSAMKRRSSEQNGNALRVRFDLSGAEGKQEKRSQENRNHACSQRHKQAAGAKEEPKKNWRYVIKKFRIKQAIVDVGLLDKGINEKDKDHFGVANRDNIVDYNGQRTAETEVSLESVKEFSVTLPNNRARCNGATTGDVFREKVLPAELERHSSCSANSLDIEKDATPLQRDTSTVPLLHVAASDGNIELMKRLIDIGVDLNAKDPNGWPAIHYAIVKGHFQCAALLMDNGVDVNCYTDEIIRDYFKTIRQVFMQKDLLENKAL